MADGRCGGGWKKWSCAALAAVFFAAGAANAQRISVEELLREPTLHDLDLSPDGQHVAMIVTSPGVDTYLLVVTDRAGNFSESTVSQFSDVTPLWVRWANNDRLLLAVASGLEITNRAIQLPSGRIIAVNIDGGDPVVLFEDQDRVLERTIDLTRISNLLPYDDLHIVMPAFLRNSLDLWRVNIYTGAAERVEGGNGNTIDWIVDNTGVPRFRVDANTRGTVLSIYAAPETGGRRWRRVARVREDDTYTFSPIAPAEETGLYYVAMRPDGEDRSGIYLYDTVAAEIVRPISTHPRVDVSAGLINTLSGAFEGVSYVEDRFEYEFADPEIQRHYDGLREFLGDELNVHIYDRSDDGRYWIVFASGPREPGTFYVYDLQTREAQLYYSTYDHIERSRFAATQIVRYTARDGVEITGYLTLPPDRAPQNLQLVVMPHGGPEVRDIYTFNPQVQHLATSGYAVFQPNFRGSAGYGRAFADAGRGQWGRAMHTDMIDGMHHLIDQGVAVPGLSCFFGASYGGYAALAAAALSPEEIKCAISVAGVADLDAYLRYSNRTFDDDEQDYWEAQIGARRADRERIREVSPIELVENIEDPILLIHGELDSQVPIEQSELMASALEDHGRVHRFLTVRGVGHSYWPITEERRLLTEASAFLSEHLRPD